MFGTPLVSSVTRRMKLSKHQPSFNSTLQSPSSTRIPKRCRPYQREYHPKTSHHCADVVAERWTFCTTTLLFHWSITKTRRRENDEPDPLQFGRLDMLQPMVDRRQGECTVLTSRGRHTTRQHPHALMHVRTVLFALSTAACNSMKCLIVGTKNTRQNSVERQHQPHNTGTLLHGAST